MINNDKILENINTKIESLSSSVKNQLSFNKMIETQLAQITAALPVKLEKTNIYENVKAVTTRGGKSTRDPPNPNHVAGKQKAQQQRESTQNQEPAEEEEEELTPPEYGDSSFLPFQNNKTRKQAVDEQFARFVEMIEKIHVSVPLMDVLHVPSYAKYIKDIINNKRPLSSTEVVKLTKECSAAILNQIPEKKKDPSWVPHHHLLNWGPAVRSCTLRPRGLSMRDPRESSWTSFPEDWAR